MMLPGRTAAKVRVKASVLLTRFLAGVLTLVGEVYGMAALQEHLREHQPDHPLCAFREAVDAGQTTGGTTADAVSSSDNSSALLVALQIEEKRLDIEFKRRKQEAELEDDSKKRQAELEDDRTSETTMLSPMFLMFKNPFALHQFIGYLHFKNEK